MALRIAFLGNQHDLVSVGIHPGIPEEYLGPMWSNGTCQGVNEAVTDVDYDFAFGDLKVGIDAFFVSKALASLSDEELETVRNGFSELARELLAPLVWSAVRLM